ncbi:Uncharacterised protein [Zhongshania aliphaticivorans]|uniref:PpiC domain-containing protein n=1 Tax=Zhongshania aliphaticivorans TaxID=1470434 RepID=A0A5S9QM74_9GAMM|nr:peptidylprolyl isomerase [Zhongshania aliphaticivorans]CAA0087626.1 Uncharacterised protein [Zhongshania aliphaticivorans]CAA0115232.1 Uncharacterised protein [Zhongshania aliphaticivorans]CAA0120075.1 Uncharacterised protein [Zhongshania aliphaticivorans]
MQILSSRPLHFLIIGVALTLLNDRYTLYQQRYITCVSKSQLAVLATDWQRNTAQEMTLNQLREIEQAALDENMLVKEAMLQGFHKRDQVVIQRLLRDADFLGIAGGVKQKIDAVLAMDVATGDEVIRRRLVQLLKHQVQVSSEVHSPSEHELTVLYHSRKDLGVVPSRISFEHLYFDSTAGNAKERAELALSEENVDMQSGDVFLGGNYFANMTTTTMASTFGEEFLQAVDITSVAKGEWFGPLRSQHGFHLVRITAAETAFRRSQKELHTELIGLWRESQQTKRWQEYVGQLRGRYRNVCDANY